MAAQLSAQGNTTAIATEAAIVALRLAQQSQQPSSQPDNSQPQANQSALNNIWQSVKTGVLEFSKNAAIDYPKITLLVGSIMAYSLVYNAGIINLSITGLVIVTIALNKEDYWKAFSYYVEKKSEFVWDRNEKIQNRQEISKNKGLTISDIAKISWKHILQATQDHPQIVSISAVAFLFIGIIKASIICYCAAIVATAACVFKRNAVFDTYYAYFATPAPEQKSID